MELDMIFHNMTDLQFPASIALSKAVEICVKMLAHVVINRIVANRNCRLVVHQTELSRCSYDKLAKKMLIQMPWHAAMVLKEKRC
jgi:hypothetical protein